MPFVAAMVLVPAVPVPSELLDTLAPAINKVCLQSASKYSPRCGASGKSGTHLHLGCRPSYLALKTKLIGMVSFPVMVNS